MGEGRGGGPGRAGLGWTGPARPPRSAPLRGPGGAADRLPAAGTPPPGPRKLRRAFSAGGSGVSRRDRAPRHNAGSAERPGPAPEGGGGSWRGPARPRGRRQRVPPPAVPPSQPVAPPPGRAPPRMGPAGADPGRALVAGRPMNMYAISARPGRGRGARRGGLTSCWVFSPASPRVPILHAGSLVVRLGLRRRVPWGRCRAPPTPRSLGA